MVRIGGEQSHAGTCFSTYAELSCSNHFAHTRHSSEASMGAYFKSPLSISASTMLVLLLSNARQRGGSLPQTRWSTGS